MKTKKMTRAECEKNGGDLNHPNYHARWKALAKEKPRLIANAKFVRIALQSIGAKRGVYSLLADKSPIGAFGDLVDVYKKKETAVICDRYGNVGIIGGVTKEGELTALRGHCDSLNQQFADLIA